MTNGARSTLTSADGELTTWMEVYTRSLFVAALGTKQMETAEPRPDTKALDILLGYPSVWLGVQLKSTYSHSFNQSGTFQFPVKPKWVKHWHRQSVPPRLVVYMLDKDSTRWRSERALGEMHRVHAYWARLDRGVSAPSVTIERSHRFTVATLAQWGQELQHGMGGRP